MHRRSTILRALALLIAAALGTLALAGPASAHSDVGEMTVTVAEATGPTEVVLQVGILYQGDDHLAVDAAVSATGTSATGASVGPIDLPNEVDALYGATVTVPEPGAWTFTITSTEPAATATTAVEVSATGPTVTAGGTDGAPNTTAATEEVTGDEAAFVSDAGDDDSSGGRIAIAVGAAVVVGAVALYFGIRRSRGSRTG